MNRTPAAEIERLFVERFGVKPVKVVGAPGRLELLGNHTDYNQGLVLSLAIDRHIFIAVGPRRDGRIVLASSAFAATETFPCDRIEKKDQAPWSDYVKGVLKEFERRGGRFSGFQAAIHGTIPLGAGMSSSAALEVAAILAVRALFPFQAALGRVVMLPPVRSGASGAPSAEEKLFLAELCQAAEHDFVGVRCGLLDQISSLFGMAGQAIGIDCQSKQVTHHPLPGGVTVVVCDSGIKHALVAGEYNERRRCCESAARKLGVPALRWADPAFLEKNRARLDAREYECAYHVIGENQRVLFGERALREGDIEQFGQYLFQSHESSRLFFKNSCEELDTLVELARRQPGCFGARLTGGGFGGATIQLVEAARVVEFRQALARGYAEATGRALEPMVCRVVNGAAGAI